MIDSPDKIIAPDAISFPEIRAMHIRASNFFGGPEKQILEHLKLLKKGQIQPLLCSFCEKGGETELAVRARALGIRSFSVRCLGAYDPAQVLRLRKIFTREKPHLVCTHDYRSTFLSLIARPMLPVRQIAFLRGVTKENLKVALFYKIENRLLRGMDHVVVVSKKQQDSVIVKGCPAGKVSLVPNAVEIELDDNLSTPSTLLRKFRGKTIIATAGRLSPEKGHEYLIEAMPRVTAGRKDAVLLVFGDGPLREHLTRLAGKVGCGDSIHFLGYVPGFSSFLKDIHLFVLPSLMEGLPNALLEALAAAKPVVATAVGGVPDIVTDRKTGIVVLPRDSARLGDAITELLSDRGLAQALGLAGQEVIRESYSFEKQLRLLMDVYKKTLSVEKT